MPKLFMIETNELHASGEFYAAQLKRYHCENCRRAAAFLVEVYSDEIKTGLSCCAACVNTLIKQGWINVEKAYLAK